jgi:endonuclease/exonuclease/phosphatase family metal-dependent hydrolase
VNILTPNHDIDYELTYGIKISSITILAKNSPAASDHLGIVFDIDLASYFLLNALISAFILPEC